MLVEIENGQLTVGSFYTPKGHTLSIPGRTDNYRRIACCLSLAARIRSLSIASDLFKLAWCLLGLICERTSIVAVTEPLAIRA